MYEKWDLFLKSEDNAVAFQFERVSTGVWVERQRTKPGVRHQREAAIFGTEAGLIQWLGNDQLQFAYPVVFDQIKRRVGVLFQ
jgi:hypothetical protein